MSLPLAYLVELLPRPHPRAAVLLLAGFAYRVEGSHHVQQVVRIGVMAAFVSSHRVPSSSHARQARSQFGKFDDFDQFDNLFSP